MSELTYLRRVCPGISFQYVSILVCGERNLHHHPLERTAAVRQDSAQLHIDHVADDTLHGYLRIDHADVNADHFRVDNDPRALLHTSRGGLHARKDPVGEPERQ